MERGRGRARPGWRIVGSVALAVLAAACSAACSGGGDGGAGDGRGGGEPPAPAPVPALVAIDPSTTGVGISPAFGDHLVGAPDGGGRGELVVFLPGTGARPDDYETFLRHALALGDHVIGLAYRNDVAVNFDVCVRNPDPACPERARTEILFGVDAPGLPVDVPPADAAVPRLVAALTHLAATRPGEGWDAYLDPAGRPQWSRVVTAGHSQGGGHAVFLGRDEELARVLLFDATEPAAWTLEPLATPPARMWGLVHADEPIAAPIQRSWEQLRLPGTPVDVDAAPPPWGGSHRLVTSTDECRGDPASRAYHHNCPVVDDFLPDPVPPSLLAAWDRMLTG